LFNNQNRDLREEKRRIDDEKKALETKLREVEAEKAGLRKNVAREQELLNKKNRELIAEKLRLDEEKKTLQARLRDAENKRIRYVSLRIRNELRTERMELANLKKSIEELRAENVRERKRLGREREALLKTRARLEKRKIARKTALKLRKARGMKLRKIPFWMIDY
jgi:chromosome segregation ATPase